MIGDWTEERRLRLNAIRGSRKLLEAILKARGIPIRRKRTYKPRQRGYQEHPKVLQFQRAVARHYGLRADSLYIEGRSRWHTRPRQVAMYLAHTVGGVSLPLIGKHFNRDHTTVLHACRAVERTNSLSTVARAISQKLGDNSLLILRNSQEDAIEHSVNNQEELMAA